MIILLFYTTDVRIHMHHTTVLKLTQIIIVLKKIKLLFLIKSILNSEGVCPARCVLCEWLPSDCKDIQRRNNGTMLATCDGLQVDLWWMVLQREGVRMRVSPKVGLCVDVELLQLCFLGSPSGGCQGL